MNESDTASLAFEGALDELEALVEKLETGDLALEQALATFERGVALSRRCSELLERAEQRIDELVRASGGAAVRPFAIDNGDRKEGDEGRPTRSEAEPSVGGSPSASDQRARRPGVGG